MVNYGPICQLVSMDLGLLCQWLEEKDRIAPILRSHHHDSWTIQNCCWCFFPQLILQLGNCTIDHKLFVFTYRNAQKTFTMWNLTFCVIWDMKNKWISLNQKCIILCIWNDCALCAQNNISSLTAKNTLQIHRQS